MPLPALAEAITDGVDLVPVSDGPAAGGPVAEGPVAEGPAPEFPTTVK
jgi:hypothetical protein